MKIKVSLLFVLIGIFCVGIAAQSVVITRKKVTYTRKKPIVDFKRTFTINYPKVKAATPALSRKIENAMSYESILGLKLREELNGYQWLEEADYEVGYNQNDILSIALTMSGSAAYPSGHTKHVVVDLKTGARSRPAEVFTKLSGLLKMVRKAKDNEVAQTMTDIKKDPANSDLEPEVLFTEAAGYSPLKLDDFSVDKTGATFYYDYGFRHVVKALQPAGEFRFTWQQLKPYIKRGGLLARIAR